MEFTITVIMGEKPLLIDKIVLESFGLTTDPKPIKCMLTRQKLGELLSIGFDKVVVEKGWNIYIYI